MATTTKIRNFGLFAHGGAGKTSLVEALLFTSGAVSRLGRVDDGTATTDYDPEEISRKISINAALAYCNWQDHELNIIDTPGYADFLGEVRSAISAVDAAIIVICAASGVEVGTETAWRYADEYNLPRLIFINKIDRENANFQKTLEEIKQAFGRKPIPVQLPIGAEENFQGIIDILTQKAFIYTDNLNYEFQETPIPPEYPDLASQYHENLIEAAAENDDELLAKYLEAQELLPQEINRGLKAAVIAGNIVPVFCGSAYKNIGMSPLLDAIVNWLPSPQQRGEIKGTNPTSNEQETRPPDPDQPLTAFVFKTMTDPYIGKLNFIRLYSGTLKPDSQVYNATQDKIERIGQVFQLIGKKQTAAESIIPGQFAVIPKLAITTTGDTLTVKEKPIILTPPQFPEPVYSVAVEPKTRGDEDKLGTALTRLAEEDPTLSVRREAEIRQTLLSGMGEAHLEVIMDRLKRKFGVDVHLETPRVPYKETITKTATAGYRHKKQSGGHGQFGEVSLELEPKPRGEGFEFIDKIFGGAIPKGYIPGVEKGVRQAISEGVIAGYPIVDIKVTLYDGSYHPVDSSELSFKIAGLMALKKGVREADPVLLEPIMDVEVTVPERFMGDIMGDLNSRRGRILGMEHRGTLQVIKAQVPLAEMLKYAITINSITGGRGTFTIKLNHYEEVPAHITEKIIAQAKKET